MWALLSSAFVLRTRSLAERLRVPRFTSCSLYHAALLVASLNVRRHRAPHGRAQGDTSQLPLTRAQAPQTEAQTPPRLAADGSPIGAPARPRTARITSFPERTPNRQLTSAEQLTPRSAKTSAPHRTGYVGTRWPAGTRRRHRGHSTGGTDEHARRPDPGASGHRVLRRTVPQVRHRAPLLRGRPRSSRSRGSSRRPRLDWSAR
jgi:hypothetical protein